MIVSGILQRRRDQRAAAWLIITTQHGSAGMLRRQMGVSFRRAQLLLEDLEEQGIVGSKKPDSGRARDVLIPFPGPAKLRDLVDAAFPSLDTQRPPARCRDCSDMGLPTCTGTCS